MQKIGFAAIALVCTLGLASSVAQPADDGKAKSAGSEWKLPANWADSVTVQDLTVELSDSSTRLAQNLKKAGDFDKFLKNINTEGHLTAILAGLIMIHPEAGDWKGIAADIQTQSLALAKAAEAKGVKNFRTAQDAHKKIQDLLKKGEKAGMGSGGTAETAATDWPSLGELGDVMKRVDPAYKFIRGKMSSENYFKKDVEGIRHQAAILNALSQITPAFRPNEKDMVNLSATMVSGSQAIVDAAKNGDYAKANEANTAINASCNECHKVKRFQKKGSDFDF